MLLRPTPHLAVTSWKRRDQAGVPALRSTQLAQHRPRPRPRTTGASQLRTFTRNFALFLTTSLIANCPFRTTELLWHFSVPLDQRAPPSPNSVVGRAGAGFAQLGVSRRGCGFVVCASRALRGAKKHRTAALFRVSVASHLPARIPIVGLTCAMGSVALLASDRRNSTSVSSRLAPGGCWVVVKKSEVLLRCASAFGPFLIPLFGTEFYTR